jgi:class 3 adenylate cyclase/predicted ATPase
MDVGVWLRSLGLGQYEATFRDNEIEGTVLPKLTVDDLKDLGVAVVGHRRKIMSAIEELNAEFVARTDAMKALPPQAALPVSGSPSGAERRPITVMFCDLVGSTSLAAKLDAEDWRNLVNAYLDEASAAVTAFGGYVLKKLGDGLMALFGYPQAQENDAERAVRAALAIQRALSDLNARHLAKGAPELSARIGLESGPVVVEAAGEVFGDAPNVAARVQAEAEPGSVLITLNVQRQVAGLFVAEERGARELKGVSQPVQLFRVVRASGGGRRGGARTLTPFVGREEEQSLLTRRWERARVGEGQLVLVVGEPGLGKSRLIEEFHARLAETPHTWVEWSASQLLQNTPLHPIAEWGRLRFGADAPAEQRLGDLEGTLRLIGLDPAEHAPLLAPLVDIPLPPGRAANFPPEEMRRRQLAAMTAWVLAGARSQPVVLVFEDLHWADPTSLDLLRAFADRGAQVPMLLLATTRPEFRPDWSVRSHHSLISLSPLDRAQVAHMVSEISARHALSKEVIEGVSERTGGVPLFVEEVTRLLVERGAQGGVQAIPPTLQQSLAARLDRLGPAREVAQIGAVLGRDFTYTLLRDIAEADESALQASLDRLTEADLLFVEGSPPQANYRFKHALIQDAAYDSLLKTRRQALHRRAAELLRDNPDHGTAEPEAIAHHFTQAGLDDLAIEWWGKAGDQALRRSAFQEAIAHLGKAIEMADKAGEAARRVTRGPAAPSKRLTQMQVAYGNALLAARGQGAPETTAAFARARESASGDKDAPERLAADYGLWVGSYTRGELPSMRTHAAAFLSDVAARPDSSEAGVAHRAAGTTCWFAGEYREAQDHLERALALFQPGRDDDLAFRFGADPGVGAMAYLATALWPLGEVDRAVSLIDRMQTRIVDLTHVVTLAVGRLQAALFELMRGDTARAAPNALELARLAREHDLSLFRAYSVFLEGWVTAASGAFGSGLEHMRRGVGLLREQNVLLFDGLLKIALAEVETRAGDPDRALAILDEALATGGRAGNRAFEAELNRARGEILRECDPANPTRAEEALLTAIAVAKQQATRSFEVRAALALAKLYRATGRDADAHAALAPALEGFAPTPELPEIIEAQALLAALAETEEVKADAEQRHRLTQLQVAYGNALFSARGFGAPETQEAFARARESAFGDKALSDRLAADYGLWAGSYVRGELSSMRAHVEAFLGDIRATPNSPEAGIAYRICGVTHQFAGEYGDARDNLERALALFQPGRDDDLAFRFGIDVGTAVLLCSAIALWPLGEVERAMSLAENAQARLAAITHAGTLAFGRHHSALFELMRGDRVRVAQNAVELARLAREHDLTMFRAFGVFLEGWATAADGAPSSGLSEMRRGVDLLREQDVLFFDGLLKIALAEAEAQAGDSVCAVTLLDEALATADGLGYRAFEAELHRARGEILLKRDPSDPAPAEEAFLNAIAVAKRQGTRSFELRAALSLAKLYQSTGRPVEAHGVLTPALEGFSPTPEMPEIAEAQALLAELQDIDEVKAEAARRDRRLRLQTAYGYATMWSKGFAANETKAAFELATELAANTGDFSEWFAAASGQWTNALLRGELRYARNLALSLLREAEGAGRSLEVRVARRSLATVLYFCGEFREARNECERCLDEASDPERDLQIRERFGDDAGTVLMSFLAVTYWQLGEVDRARKLIESSKQRAIELEHVTSMATPLFLNCCLEFLRGDAAAALRAAEAMEALGREQGMTTFRTEGKLLSAAARGQLANPVAGAVALRQALAAHFDQGGKLNARFYKGLLAQLESEADAQSALAIIDEAFAQPDPAERWDLGFMHRLRGDILLKCGSSKGGLAEDAYRAAIAVAKDQGARSFGLQAAFALAKLYQSTSRLAEAQAVLAPALEGFAQTPEMPEIAQAQALLVAIEAGAHVGHE